MPAFEKPPTGEIYPPAGALIDYYLADQPSEEVRLEILDANGNVVRIYSSAPEGDDPPLERAGTSTIPNTAGMHRIRWDLRYHGPWPNGTSGPYAAPGKYQARLTVGGFTQTQPFQVLEDPRVLAAGTKQGDLQEQWSLNRQIVDAISEGNHLAANIDQTQEKLEDESGPDAERARQRLADLEAMVETDPNEPSYPQPMLIDQIEYLYGMTNAADQRLGQDAFVRYGQVRDQLDDALAEFQDILNECGDTCT